MRTIIVDDTKVNRLALLELVKDYLPQLDIVGEADSVESGSKAILELSPELVILDIELGDGSGFDIIERCKEVPFKVIFVTAFDHFAIRAFKVNAMDYILKPVNIKDLIHAVNRASNAIERGGDQIAGQTNNVVSISTHNGFETIEINELIRCEADGKYTDCILSGGRKVVSSKNLKVFEKLLSEKTFFRVHHSHLINIEHIKSFDRFDRTLLMKNGDVIPISQRRKKEFLEHLKKV